MIRDVEAEMAEKPRGTVLVFAGELNVDLEKVGGRGRENEIEAAVATAGLEDLAGKFFPRRRAW